MKKMKHALVIIKTLLKATIFRRKIHKYEYDGQKFYIEVSHSYRWYNPLFIVFSLVSMPFYLFSGGLADWLNDIRLACSFENTFVSQLKGEFKTKSNNLLRKFDLWQVTYRCA